MSTRREQRDELRIFQTALLVLVLGWCVLTSYRIKYLTLEVESLRANVVRLVGVCGEVRDE